MNQWWRVAILLPLCAATANAQDALKTDPRSGISFSLAVASSMSKRPVGGSRLSLTPAEGFLQPLTYRTKPGLTVGQDLSPQEELLKEVPFLGPLTLRAWRKHYSSRDWYSRNEGFNLFRLAGGQIDVGIEKQRVFLPVGDRRYSVTFRWNLNQGGP